MKAVFVHDTFYSRAPGGAIYSFGAFPYELWQERFLPNFHLLTVIGREKPFDPADAQKAIRSDGHGVRFCLLPNINKPIDRVFKAAPIINTIREEVGQADAVIIRGPSELGMIAARHAKLTLVNKPVAIEMSGCAFDHTWHHKSLTAKFYAPIKYLRARHMVKNADCVIYVTKKFLQSRYPTNAAVANASNVEIEAPSPTILEKRLIKIENRKSLIFGMIGNYGNNLKGLDIAIAALSRPHPELPPFEFRILGHGNRGLWPYEPFLRFDPPLTGKNDVLNWLDTIDIYLQPSRHEGLPRALVEAMSRACPALASDAGGIPELLDPAAIHKRGNENQLSRQILKAVNKNWQKQQAIRNFNSSKEYSREILLPRREKFWRYFASQLSSQPDKKNIAAKI